MLRPQPAFTSTKAEEAGGVGAEDGGAVGVGDGERADRLKHRWDAADLMRVVAAGEDVAGARELDGELERVRVEVHRVVIKLLQVIAGRAVDIRATFAKGVEAAVEALGEIRNRAAQMAEHPANPWEFFRDAGEDEFCGGERRVHQKTDEGHKPEVGHGLDADGRGGMDVENGVE